MPRTCNCGGSLRLITLDSNPFYFTRRCQKCGKEHTQRKRITKDEERLRLLIGKHCKQVARTT